MDAMLRAVFFDLDDTLLDTTGSRAVRARRAAMRLAVEYPDLHTDEIVSAALEYDSDRRWIRGIPRVVADLGLADTEAGRAAIDLWFFIGCPDLLIPLPTTEATLREISASYEVGIITNGPERIQRGKYDGMACLRDIRHLVISETVGWEKPDPRIFAHALSLVGVEPREAAFVGDRLDVDIAGALAVGMRAVWFNPRADDAGNGHRPDAVIRRLDELAPALGSL